MAATIRGRLIGSHARPELLVEQGTWRDHVSTGKADDVAGQALNHGGANPEWTQMVQPRPAGELWKR